MHRIKLDTAPQGLRAIRLFSFSICGPPSLLGDSYPENFTRIQRHQSKMKQSRISELASIISNQTRIVDDYLQSHGLASPSFNIDYTEATQIPKEIILAKNAITEATEELNCLIAGPVGCLTGTSVNLNVGIILFQRSTSC